MTRNIHLKFRVGGPTWDSVAAAATELGVPIEQLARESLLYAVREILRRSRQAADSIPELTGSEDVSETPSTSS